MARDPYKYFRIEAQELIDQLNRAALDLEKGTTPEIVAQLLRLAHTLKGAARVVKRADIGDCAHAVEDTLAPLRETKQAATRAQIDTLFKSLDDIHDRLASLSPPPAEQPAALPAANDSEQILRTVRVDVSEMDTLLDGFGEVHSQLGVLREKLKRSEHVHRQIDFLASESAFKESRNGKDKGRAPALLQQLGAAFDELHLSLDAGIVQLDRELRQVRDTAEKMRLIPADSLFIALERAARDAAQVQNKQVAFEGLGGMVRLDAQVLDAVQAALSHVVRNAVTHGIERAAARHDAGKPPQGLITVQVVQRDKWIEFICRDDGNGVNLDAVRRIAEQRGLLAAGAHKADTQTLLQLLLKGGISTATTISEVAGRGVGLDVVRDAAKRLDGKVELHTEAGKGTTVTLTVPLLIASLDGLLIEAGGVSATLPIAAIRSTLRIATSEIARTPHGESVIFEGRTIPFLPLASALSGKTAAIRANRNWTAVIVSGAEGMAAIGVERLLGTANIILHPLPALTPSIPLVAGVSLDAEGNPQLVLDPENLILAVQRKCASGPAQEQQARTILVIDDSLTTRMLERSILESAGYAVELAVSAEDAMNKLDGGRYALFLVDVEMPGMDGFTFIERVRAQPQWRDTPAILVTSLASEAYLQRGRDVGAQGYIIKSEFDQGALLARISELVT